MTGAPTASSDGAAMPDPFDGLRCPACRSAALDASDPATLVCADCAGRYPRDPQSGIVLFAAAGPDAGAKANIQAWWGDLYAQLYADNDARLTAESLAAGLDELEDMFRARAHLAAVEMPLADLAGNRVLEIGPGAGAHSALFVKHGARVTAVDITPQRAAATAAKFRLLGGDADAYQADAEALPFADGSFDIVYSNGVLHHSQDTDRCLAEVHRVLKPGGLAVLMLYARHSAVYWANIVPRGLFSGEMFRWPEAEWVGRVTEGKPKHGDTKNPFTRVYSDAELRRVLRGFDIVSLRKSSFQFDNVAIPRLTQIRDAMLKMAGRRPHPGGVLVYGAPYMTETPLELWLGRLIGFAWNIVAAKPGGAEGEETI